MEFIPSQEQMCAWFLPILKSEGKVFQKYRRIWAKVASGGERIETRTSDGPETVNKANPGDLIVRNQTRAREMYIMSRKNFEERYVPTGESDGEGFSEYIPTGRVIAIELTTVIMERLDLPVTFHFTASWGSEMIATAGDYLVCPISCDSVYRIARAEFFETYQPVNPTN